jgi:dTMP kinase
MFITLEGPEGSGKTTQVRMLSKYLADRGFPVVTLREPGGTPLGDRLRELLLFRQDLSVSSRAELLLFAAARAQLVDEVIRPHLAQGDVVICDRFADSTLAYQGHGRGLDRRELDEINRFATGGLVPDLTILLDLPPEVGLIRNRDGQLASDRFEGENLAFHRKVREGYLELAAADRSRWVVVDAMLPIEEVGHVICASLDARLKG